MSLKHVLSVAVVGLSLAAAGCGDRNQPVQVVGKVTVDGAPLTNGVVNFALPGGKPVIGGGAIKDGSFAVMVPPGSYKVAISGSRAVPGKTVKEMGDEPVWEPIVPAKYNSESTLTADVPDKGADLTFTLEGIKKKAAR